MIGHADSNDALRDPDGTRAGGRLRRGRLTSDGGICWWEKADSELDLCRLIADHAAECTPAEYTQA